MIDRPLNIHPNIWNLRQKKTESQETKQIQLDQFTKLFNSVDMIVQGIYLFKKNFQNIDLEQYSEIQKQTINKVNEIVDGALIPYSIDIVKQLNKLSQDGKTNE